MVLSEGFARIFGTSFDLKPGHLTSLPPMYPAAPVTKIFMKKLSLPKRFDLP